MSLFCWTQRKIFWRKFVTRLFWGTIDFHSRRENTMEVNGAPELLCFPHSSEYLPLCSAEQTHSYGFGTTWGWVNDDTIFIFGWTIPLSEMSQGGFCFQLRRIRLRARSITNVITEYWLFDIVMLSSLTPKRANTGSGSRGLLIRDVLLTVCDQATSEW